jgi:hypothetical protein
MRQSHETVVAIGPNQRDAGNADLGRNAAAAWRAG